MLNHLVIKKTDTFLKEELIDSKTVNWIIDDADVSEFEDRLLKCGFTHHRASDTYIKIRKQLDEGEDIGISILPVEKTRVLSDIII